MSQLGYIELIHALQKKHLLSVRIFCNFTILRSLHPASQHHFGQRLSVQAANLHIAVIHLAGNAFKRPAVDVAKTEQRAQPFLGNRPDRRFYLVAQRHMLMQTFADTHIKFVQRAHPCIGCAAEQAVQPLFLRAYISQFIL